MTLLTLSLIALSIVACTDRGADETGFGSTEDNDGDGFTEAGGDCDDADERVNPDMSETWYDGIDQDCDGNDTDQDLDGFMVGDDCDDRDAAINPDGTEVCDEADNDCDGLVDIGATDGNIAYVDADLDGHGAVGSETAYCGALPEGYAAVDDDCDDAQATVYPGADELCDDLDNDCDGAVNEGDPDEVPYYRDADADGFGSATESVLSCRAPAGYAETGDDCDDADSLVHPDAVEICNDLDDDCDAEVDNGAADATSYFADADSDGYGDPAVATASCRGVGGYVTNADDCDDTSATASPAGVEVCDAADNDCDGTVDELGASGETTWYVDADADGYGASTATTAACDLPVGYADDDADCDDADGTSFPSAPEADDLVDNDCDGLVDEDFVGLGDVIVTEVTRQPRFGAAATNTDGAWFELYNDSGRDIDLSNWYVSRYSETGARDGFYIDPADSLVLGAGDYAVFCKTTTYTAAATASSTLVCDYTWGDASRASTYEGTYHDNTFSLQRDEDTLSLWLDGDTTTGTLVDDVHWTYDATDGYWPRDATLSLSLDPAYLDGIDNDDLTHWCSNSTSSAYRWYYASASAAEYGTPGAANFDCP